MRKVQINIKMEIFGDQSNEEERDCYAVYADSNNIWETICTAFSELLNLLQKNGYLLPSFGCKVGDKIKNR